LITGPRAAGKTTTAQRYVKTTVRLDQELEARAFAADPDSALRQVEEPVLLDEWQMVPEVLGAVKRSVDTGSRPGRFIVTGSAYGRVDQPMWPGTGRLVHVPVYGMTVREYLGGQSVEAASFIDRIVNREVPAAAPDTPDLHGYVELALRSGFPDALMATSDRLRESWLERYVEQLLTRDVRQSDGRRDPQLLRRYFEAYALNSAGVPQDRTIFDAAQINVKTGMAYERLLADLFVVDLVPAWYSNRLKRLVSRPKRYLIDPGLFAGALRADVSTVMRDGDLLGRVIDTFVTAQLRAELATSHSRPRLFHLRQEQGRHEVDLVVEVRGGGIVGIEVKSSSAPDREAARHLVWLSEQLGDKFLAGVVFHTGPRSFSLGERIHALPISSIWSG
jgi:uncharacterized protein